MNRAGWRTTPIFLVVFGGVACGTLLAGMIELFLVAIIMTLFAAAIIATESDYPVSE